MRVLMVRAHPVRESLLQAAGDRAAAAITRAGHEIRQIDLYADGFEPTVSEEEWRMHKTGPALSPSLQSYADALGWAEHLVLVYPTWFGGFPAMLKGWLDRVWVRGVVCETSADSSRTRSKLRHITHLTVVTTHGGSKFMNSLGGEPGRRMVRRRIRSLCSRSCHPRWVALYGNDFCTPAKRLEFLETVERRLGR